jgi:hypothetical protein
MVVADAPSHFAALASQPLLELADDVNGTVELDQFVC